MKYHLAGEDTTVTFDFLHEGQFVVPDQGTVTYTVRGTDGTKLVDSQSVNTGTDQTQIQVVVSASNNQKSGDIEKRSVVVNYQVDGHPFQMVKQYWLTDWLNFTAWPSDVRMYMGVNESELRDHEIDLTWAYFKVRREMGDNATAFDSALDATDDSAYYANMAIIYRAVLDLIPSLQLRVAQREQDDQQAYARLNNIDFEALQRRTNNAYTAAKRVIRGDDQLTPPTLMSVVAVDDPITGEAN